MDCIAYIISPKRNVGAHKSRHPLFRTWERKSATYCAPQCETIDYDRRTNSNSLIYVSVYGIFYELLKQYIAIYTKLYRAIVSYPDDWHNNRLQLAISYWHNNIISNKIHNIMTMSTTEWRSGSGRTTLCVGAEFRRDREALGSIPTTVIFLSDEHVCFPVVFYLSLF